MPKKIVTLKQHAELLLKKLDDGADAASDEQAVNWIIESYKAILEQVGVRPYGRGI